MKKIAVVLCGSGYKDGSEIRESVATLLALSQEGAKFECFAPDANQVDVVNCLTDEAMNETRNMKIEAARIARGEVRSLSELKAKDFDGLLIPGGFGVAKNLCTFAFKGSQGTVRDDMASVLNDFYNSKKNIGAICIAPALLALAFKGKALTLTLGATGEASAEIEKLGHKHQATAPHEFVVDKENKIATTPAYMYDKTELRDMYAGIQGVVRFVLT